VLEIRWILAEMPIIARVKDLQLPDCTCREEIFQDKQNKKKEIKLNLGRYVLLDDASYPMGNILQIWMLKGGGA